MVRQRQAWTHSDGGVVLVGLALGYDPPPALPKEEPLLGPALPKATLWIIHG
jgi:hypothetical protein